MLIGELNIFATLFNSCLSLSICSFLLFSSCCFLLCSCLSLSIAITLACSCSLCSLSGKTTYILSEIAIYLFDSIDLYIGSNIKQQLKNKILHLFSYVINIQQNLRKWTKKLINHMIILFAQQNHHIKNWLPRQRAIEFRSPTVGESFINIAVKESYSGGLLPAPSCHWGWIKSCCSPRNSCVINTQSFKQAASRGEFSVHFVRSLYSHPVLVHPF